MSWMICRIHRKHEMETDIEVSLMFLEIYLHM